MAEASSPSSSSSPLSLEEFGERVEAIVASGGSDREERLAELVARACAEAVEGSEPGPRVVACEWLPRCWVAGSDLDAKRLRSALRRRCIREEFLAMPPKARLTVEDDDASARRRRRRVREAEVQVLLRVAVPRIGKGSAPGKLKKKEERAVGLWLEMASFDLTFPSGDTGESFRLFFQNLAPLLNRFAPATFRNLERAFDLDDTSAGGGGTTPATAAKQKSRAFFVHVPAAADAPAAAPKRKPTASTDRAPKQLRRTVVVEPPPLTTRGTTTTSLSQQQSSSSSLLSRQRQRDASSQQPPVRRLLPDKPKLGGGDRRGGALRALAAARSLVPKSSVAAKSRLAAAEKPEQQAAAVATRSVRDLGARELAALSPSPVRERASAAAVKRPRVDDGDGEPPSVVRRLPLTASPCVSFFVSLLTSSSFRAPRQPRRRVIAETPAAPQRQNHRRR